MSVKGRNDSLSSSIDPESPWTFDTTRDSQDYNLTRAQCAATFSGLFAELDRAVAHRKTAGPITPGDIDINWSSGAIRAMIHNRQLSILSHTLLPSSHHRMRALAILHAINRAVLTSRDPVPNIEFAFSIADIADPYRLGRTIWALSRRPEEKEKWLMSDFGYWSWPLGQVGEYSQIRAEIVDAERGVEFKDKIPQAVWRGAAGTNALRKDLLRVTKGKNWADVRELFWASATELRPESASLALSIPAHCRYQFVVQTEGRSYSGRGKYLQNCRSVFVAHKRVWIEPHHALLVPAGPDQNYVEVESDFSDLEGKIQDLRKRPAEAERIARNGVKVFRDRVLTPAAQACYWRRLFEAWASVSFEPEAWEMVEVKGRVARKLRGVPFESFV
ncbi:hypothetical protein EJ06DRAFT_541149 [Trichodelitschia bisporula]|uniref:Glycosyl transferase CAP10 domain-containing protein n=1 Tax=Trichodelitschia bisporula TaxID=703511 RepID=A0A6G1I8R3_9PEZI|nr:hypothetical protein EJ06DRAFT_541149 [Trichodelitschia bisporula]